MDRIEIEKELQANPELLKTILAAATLTPDDLQTVIEFAEKQKRNRRPDDTTPN